MGIPKWIKPFYIISALYDGILGIAFLVAHEAIFTATQVPPPNHVGYIQFPAFILITFAYMFYNIAKNPIANKNLIIYGILLKFSYCLAVIPHWLTGNIPSLWMPFAFFDLLFMIVFIISYKTLKKLG